MILRFSTAGLPGEFYALLPDAVKKPQRTQAHTFFG
jgi:hypothetical protein